MTPAAAAGASTDATTASAPPPAVPAAAPGPAELPDGMAAEAALLGAFSEVPTVNRATVRQAASGGVVLTATLQQRNLFGNAQRRYNIIATLPHLSAAGGGDGPVTGLVGLPQEISADVLLTSVSPSGTQQLVVLKGHNDATSALLQVWRGARMVMELAVPKTLHGPLVNDGYFASGVSWAADESAVVYTAETPAPERTPNWYGIGGPPLPPVITSSATTTKKAAEVAALASTVGESKVAEALMQVTAVATDLVTVTDSVRAASGSSEPAPRTWRGVGAAVEDWGELNTGKRPPAPYVLDMARGEVLKVPGLPAEHSVGQPTWCPPQPAASSAASEAPDSAPSSAATAAATTTTSTNTTTTTTSTGGGPSGLVFVAWPHRPPPSFTRLAAAASPRKLGVVFCYNRSAHLYHIAVQRGADGALKFGESAARLAPSLESALSPTFSPAGDALVFVSHEEAVQTGTHGATARLFRLDWSPETGSPAAPEPRLLVDVVQRPMGPHAFPGLYTASIPDDGFVGPTTLLLGTQWGAVTAIAAVDISARGPGSTSSPAPDVLPLTPVDAEGVAGPLGGCWSLLGVAGGVVLANRVAPDCPSQLYVATLPEDRTSLTAGGSGSPPLKWRPVGLGGPSGDSTRGDLPPAVQEALDSLQYSVLQVQPRVGDTSSTFDCLVWRPRDKEGEAAGPRPAVIVPHGGPHTAVTLGWYPPYAYMASLGYVVMSPNYRGSTGYGQAALASLPGAIGRQDVDDNMACLEAAVKEGLVDPARVSVVGGSHGGFLTAHLLGQHPAAFRAGVMRNPVTNISAMIAASDIPDWCYVEVFGSEEGRRRCSPVPTPADLAAMYDASPVVHVDRVTAPVFVMLGARDRRVPPPDGLQYLTALRGRDVTAAGPPPPSRLIVFPEDAHGLDKPQTEYEQWLNAAWWLKTYSSSTAAAVTTATAGDSSSLASE